MSYEKQAWSKYDALKSEEENIENGAVVTDSRMNHMEDGIEVNSNAVENHIANKLNPHSVTKNQVGLGNVQNFGLATENEAKQGTSNAKYMTPSLTQAVLSANINSIAYANSTDGTDGFTVAYPDLNLWDGTKDFSGTWSNSSSWTTDGTYKGLTVKKRTARGDGIYKTFTAPQSGVYTFSAYVKSTGDEANVFRYGAINSIDDGSQGPIQKFIGNNFDWIRDTVTLNLKANDSVWIRYEISGAGTDSILWVAGYKWEQGSTATPWMPSASEVTTADWPKYVGFSNTVKTNKSASDYTWFPVKDSELTNKVESHINNKANPHAVTASQVGTYSKQEIDTKLSKAVMADDSGKVTIKDLVASSITLPNDTDGWVTLQNLHYKKKNGLVSFWFDFTTTAAGTAVVGTFPDGFIPLNDVMFVIVNWATTTASSKVLQLTGLNSSINTGSVGILNAVANTRYTGHFTFSI